MFLQNIWKNLLLINTILEVHSNFDIILIQEPLWTTIWSIPSSKNMESKVLVRVLLHPNWMTFIRPALSERDYLYVVSYINIRVSAMQFSLWNDTFSHRDVLLIFFFNNNIFFYLINIYSNLSQVALKYLKNTEVVLCNVLVKTKDFNIQDNL